MFLYCHIVQYVFYTALGLRLLQSAQCEIDLFAASFAYMFFVKLIGKNFDLLFTIGAFTSKRFKTFELLKSRTMLWSSHGDLLTLVGVIATKIIHPFAHLHVPYEEANLITCIRS